MITDLIAFLIFTVNLLFWLLLFSRFALYRDSEKLQIQKPNGIMEEVSVILCVRNEKENIRDLLNDLLHQDHPKHSVFIIDDASTDGTTEILKELSVQHADKLKLKINPTHKGKKISLHESLGEIKSPILLFTDGDCSIKSESWITEMTQKIKGDKKLVLGFGPLEYRPTFINLFARFETAMTAIQYFSYALAGIPYMGVGRNLAYRKELFDQSGGFGSHLEILSGDDDLFINKVANAKNTDIQIDPKTFVFSEAPGKWRNYFRQKRRHISTASHYSLVHKMMLSVFGASQILIFLSILLVGIKSFLILWVIRMILILPVFSLSIKKLDQKNLLFFFPFLDICLSFYYLIMSWAEILPNKQKW